MSNDANELAPLVHVVTPELPKLDIDLAHAAEARLAPPTAEQIRAADGAFAAHKQHDGAADLLGLCSSALVLHDIAVETFEPGEEEEEQQEKDELEL